MIHITVKVSGASVDVSVNEPLTSGTVGATASFTFDAAWDGLVKTAVFKSGGVTRDVVDIGDTVTVPWEVLAKKYNDLFVGVYGTSENGEIVVPTLWAKVGTIQPGADPSGDESTDPSLPVWQQLSDRIDEIAAGGGGTGKDGASAYQIAVKNGFKGTEAEWLESLKGKDGSPGKDGANGLTPVRGVDYWTDKDKDEIKSYVDEAILGGAW